MSGPEQLEGGPSSPPGRRRRGLLAAVVLVLAGLGIHHAVEARTAPAPTTQPSASSTRRPRLPPPWPGGAVLPTGTLYVLSDAGLYTVDAVSGLVATTGLRVEASGTRLVPLAGGVLAWRPTGGPPALVAPGSRDGRPVGGAARRAGGVLAGDGEQVWVSQGDAQDARASGSWRRVDDQGRTTASVEVQGLAEPDGAGGLFDADVDGSTLRHVYPGTPVRWRDTVVLATGPDGFTLLTCARGRCTARLHDRTTGAVTEVAPFSMSGEPGVLAPGNAFVARVEVDADDRDEVRVSETTTGVLRRSFPSGAHGTSFVWLSERWLVSTSDSGVMLYDAVDDVLVQPALPVAAITQLVWQST